MTAPVFKKMPRIVFPLVLLLCAACAAPLVLVSKSAAVPAGVDLSGRWELRGEPNHKRPATRTQEALIPTGGKQQAQRQRSPRGASVPIFLEYGSSLKLTQTQYGIFISYDRSVVEEYTFGENREIEIGPIEALRVSGWDGNSFVVETLDQSGTTLFESWHLDDDGSILVRDIRIAKGEKSSFVQQQIFDRK